MPLLPSGSLHLKPASPPRRRIPASSLPGRSCRKPARYRRHLPSTKARCASTPPSATRRGLRPRSGGSRLFTRPGSRPRTCSRPRAPRSTSSRSGICSRWAGTTMLRPRSRRCVPRTPGTCRPLISPRSSRRRSGATSSSQPRISATGSRSWRSRRKIRISWFAARWTCSGASRRPLHSSTTKTGRSTSIDIS